MKKLSTQEKLLINFVKYWQVPGEIYVPVHLNLIKESSCHICFNHMKNEVKYLQRTEL